MRNRINMFFLFLVGFTFAIPTMATDMTWSNTAGDYDLGNAQNWGGTLPEGANHTATISTKVTHPAWLKLSAVSTLQPYAITVKNDIDLDLGTGSVFTALHRVYFNTDSALTLRSGTFGVDWESASGERFFMGDSGNNGGSITVDGPDAIITSSQKNTLQIGTNLKDYRLNILNGATLQANITLGNTLLQASNNVVWIEGPGSKHLVPSDSTVAPIAIGSTAPHCSYILTNQASLVVERDAGIFVGSFYSAVPGGLAAMHVLDHSTVDTLGSLYIGNYSGTNSLYVSGASTFNCAEFRLGENPWSKGDLKDAGVGPSFANTATIRGDGTRLAASGNVYIGGTYTQSNVFRLEDGAWMQASASTVVGNDLATNNIAYIGTNAVFDALGAVTIGNSASTAFNQMIVDAGTFYVTNNPSARNIAVGNRGFGNRLEVVNGATVYMTNVHFYVGSNSDSNVLVIADGAKWREEEEGLAKRNWGIHGIGSYNGIIVDNATLELPQNILRIGNNANSSNNWVRIVNNSIVPIYRTIMGEQGTDNTLEVANSLFTMWGSLQVGHKTATSYRQRLWVHGTNTYITVNEGLDIGPDCELKFTIEGEGFLSNTVMYVNSLWPTETVTADHPYTVRIEAAHGAKPGVYTLMQSKIANNLHWGAEDLFKLEYDPKYIQIVQRDSSKLVVKVKHHGMTVLLR